MDRERGILMREAEASSTIGERESDRMDRIVERLGDAIESVGVEAARESVSKMEPADVMKLIEQYGPLLAKLGGN
jgi:hypothetical protein